MKTPPRPTHWITVKQKMKFFDRMVIQKSLWLTVLLFQLVIGTSVAQQTWDNEGELEDVEVEIVKERQINLPKANRNFEKIPPLPSDNVRPSFRYDFRPFTFQAPQLNPAIRPLRIKQQEKEEVFGGYISGGYGNYASPYLEGFINSKRDRNKLVGAHGYFRASNKGPVDDENSGSGSSGLSVFGKTFNDVIALSGEVGFENQATHFYGYPPGTDVRPDDIRQTFNIFSLNADLSNSKKTSFAYTLGAGFSYLADHYDARESEVDLSFRSSYAMKDRSVIGLQANYFLISRKDAQVEVRPRSLFTVNPRYEFYIVDELKMSAGIVAAFENDTLDNRDVHAYPDIRVSYPLSPSVDLVAALSGGIEKVSLHSLVEENLWLAPNVPIYHTNKLFDLQAALHTRIGNKVSVHGGFSLAALKNLYFFTSDASDQSRFVPVYDDVTRRLNLFASLGFVQAELFKFLVRGDLFSYGTDLPEAWHRPTYKLTGETSLNVNKKILLDVDLIAQGGMKAFDFTTDTVVELDPAFDLNVRTEYLISDRFSVFVELNNITSNNYPVFLNYPVRGFQVLGGLTWSF